MALMSFFRRFQRPPGAIPSSFLGLEAITGSLENFGFEDYLNGNKILTYFQIPAYLSIFSPKFQTISFATISLISLRIPCGFSNEHMAIAYLILSLVRLGTIIHFVYYSHGNVDEYLNCLGPSWDLTLLILSTN